MYKRGFIKGINLGGWMSQCDYSRERLDGFITEKDIEQIAAWGFDHVRLPFDYNIVQNSDGSFIEDGFRRLEEAVSLSKKHGLRIVLDLHKTAGFSFDHGEEESGFFDSEELQEKFYSLWEEMAGRFGNDTENIVFELLNEVTDEEFIGRWNKIAAKCIERIRKIAPTIGILLGSYHNNGAREVAALDVPFDENLIYNFHCYDPLKFTHQGATWTPVIDPDARQPFEESGVSEAYFEELFSAAIAKAEKDGVTLYCGEYGVIDRVPAEDVVKWYAAINAVLEKHKIGRSAWCYKEMDFGITDDRLDGCRDELLRYM